MQYFRNPENAQVYGYDSTEQQPLIESAIEAGWIDVSDCWPPAPEPLPEQSAVDPIEKLRAFLRANPDVAALLQK